MRFVLGVCFGGLSLLLSLAAAPASAPSSEPDSPITIQRGEATVKRTMFDRAHPPPEMPKLTGNEAALTQSNFECGASVSYQVIQHQQVGDHWHVTARIHDVHMRVSLADTIFLPQMAPLLLRAHEEGHRVMNERVYQEGEPIARAAAAELLSHDWEGDGPDPEAAGKAATDAGVQHLCNVYLDGTAKRASHLGDIYDRLTDHGRNRLMVANAIRLSFEQEQKEAATQPVHQPGQIKILK